MCDSRFGIPIPYSKFPEQNEQFYYTPQNPDPYNDITSSSYRQLFQLQRDSLLPVSWSASERPAQGQLGCADAGASDWYKYAPTRDGFNRYITATGASRIRTMTRNPAGRIVGASNLLRTNAPVPLSRDEPWFNSSGMRTDLVDSLGCGPVPPGCNY